MALSKAEPGSADVAYELALALIETGQRDQARAALTLATDLRPSFGEAWRALGDQHLLAGQTEAADAAYALQIKASIEEPQLLQAAVALGDGQLGVAEALLRTYLKAKPGDAPALRMLAVVAMRLGRMGDAELILLDCLDAAPGFVAARRSYATLLYRANKSELALEQLDILLTHDPRDPSSRNMRAAVLAQLGDFEGSIAHYAAVLSDFPNQPKAWMSYGHALKTVGRQSESVDAYRMALSQAPHLGEAWWSLANLKTLRFSSDDIAAMQAQLAIETLSEEDRCHLDFALGKAFEDAKSYEDSFTHYARANALRRTQVDYDACDLSRHVSRSIDVYTKDYFQSRAGWGDNRADPIFVVGLPRAGSTLVEQVLSSHSLIEGTTELPDIIAISKQLGQQKHYKDLSAYPEVMATLNEQTCQELGAGFFESTQIQRHTDRPFFIDKMPNNFQHIGLIASILPRAKIIDVRRHPMACCFAGFKQHFARGQNFSTSLEDIGHYCVNYMRLMDHFDQVLPGRVYRIIYEDLVANSETQIRSMLDYCGLEFEAACLTAHETKRAVRTPSSEQVRRPIYSDALEQWKYYEPFLQPLQNIVGNLINSYKIKARP
jgi:tetratricopeptide (TPR) repeat protein